MMSSLRRKFTSGLLFIPLLAGGLLLCLPACSTLGTLSRGDKYLLSGTRENISVQDPARSEEPWIGLGRCIGVFDFPFSLALDVALIPVTLPLQLIHGDAPRPQRLPPTEDEDARKK